MPKKAFFSIAESKRETILRCALTEFSDYGYHDASINRIVKSAGIPRGSFYQYFENKEDLFFHLFETILHQELKHYLKDLVGEMPADPFRFHQIMFTFNLHMLNNAQYHRFFRHLFLAMDYRFTCRYKEIANNQRNLAMSNLGLADSETGQRLKETLEIFSLITMELLAMKALDEISDEEVWNRYYARFHLLGWDTV